MVTNMFIIKKSYLYWSAEICFFLYVIIVITITNINEMIVRAIFVNNDNINNCKSISSNVLHYLAFFCKIKMATTFYFSLFSLLIIYFILLIVNDFSKTFVYIVRKLFPKIFSRFVYVII